MFFKQEGLCLFCGDELDLSIKNMEKPDYVTKDHFFPKCMGYTKAKTNLCLLHRKCNGKKADKVPSEIDHLLFEKITNTSRIVTLSQAIEEIQELVPIFIHPKMFEYWHAKFARR